MRRREFITLVGGAAMMWPLAARAQQPDRVRRVGVLIGYAEDDSETKGRLAAFRQGLERRKWVEGRNIQIEHRFAAASAGQHQELAKELVAMQPDVILAHTTPVTAALQRASHSIPVVFVNVSDPVGSGFIANLARPGGNLTGLLHYEPGIVGKWLGMLKEIAPRVTRVALMANRKTSPFDYFVRSGQTAASSLGIELVPRDVANADELERTVTSFARLPDSGLVVPPDATNFAHRDHIIGLAARHRLPAVYSVHAFVAAGGLMSYGTDQNDMFRLAASYVDRILRGDKPADLPVQAPTKYETVVNLKTAKALGLTVPSGMLVAADEVIE